MFASSLITDTGASGFSASHILSLVFDFSAQHDPSCLPYLHGWVEARVKQGFVFNDVADSRHDGLVEENVAEHPARLAPHRLLGAGEAELGGADVQTLHSPDLLLTVLRQPASTRAVSLAPQTFQKTNAHQFCRRSAGAV